MNDEDILYLSNIAFSNKDSIKCFSFERCYTKFYKLTLKKKSLIIDWFNRLFSYFEKQNRLIKQIQSSGDVLMFPIRHYDIDYHDRCIKINNNILDRRVAIIQCLKQLPMDIIITIYCI